MNKKEITKELDIFVKSIDKHFEVKNDGQLNLKLGTEYLLILDWDAEGLYMGFEIGLKDAERVAKSGIISKFYKKAVKLIDKMDEKGSQKNNKSK